VEHPGRLITHDELLDALWPETFVQPQILRTYMLELRKILGDNIDEPKFIQTHPKRGYCFVAVVSEAVPGAVPRDAGQISAPTLNQPSKLVGREKELARLCAELQLVEGGQRRIVFISGEEGIGKTTLTDVLAETWCRQSDPSSSIALARGSVFRVLAFGSSTIPFLKRWATFVHPRMARPHAASCRAWRRSGLLCSADKQQKLQIRRTKAMLERANRTIYAQRLRRLQP